MTRVPRAVRGRVRWLAQRLLLWMAARWNLYIVSGLDNEANRIDSRPILDGTRWYVTSDVVRAATLELLSREVHELAVPGAVAELGVNRGDFAALVSHHFPDRALHLFDTFEGFDPRDMDVDRTRRYRSEFNDFSDTSVSLVLARLPHPERAHVHAGWFPETAGPCAQECFCFVSLDVDLFQPTYEGLRFFYPRLAPGGSILVHDYNNEGHRGAKEAVRAFAREMGVATAPIPDSGGSVVITKPLAVSVEAARA